MRHLSLGFLSLMFVFACGGGSDEIVEIDVVELSNAEQIDLCEVYLDGVCADDPTICDDPCIDTGCQAATENGDIDANCDLGTDGLPITDVLVEDCAAGDLDACDIGGDCILDALDDACSA
jgi:hypothetical protein